VRISGDAPAQRPSIQATCPRELHPDGPEAGYALTISVDHPSGALQGSSTIYGNRQRGTGILNNELYIGRQVWNRLRYTKDPSTGKRVSRMNNEKDWVITDVPDLRIVDQDVWDMTCPPKPPAL